MHLFKLFSTRKITVQIDRIQLFEPALAEICGEYLHKGKQAYVEGRLQTREWEDKDGNRRWTTEIVANEMQMLGPKGGDSSGGGDYYKAPGMGDAPPAGNDMDDDIPF